jgi:hypothetical protein
MLLWQAGKFTYFLGFTLPATNRRNLSNSPEQKLPVAGLGSKDRKVFWRGEGSGKT